MQRPLIRTIRRRRPFRVIHVPWLARVYRYPFNKYPSLNRAIVFGLPNLAVFWLAQRLCPGRVEGLFSFDNGTQVRHVHFNAKNTQFSALYFQMFSGGYEPHLCALLDILVPPDGVFVDVGSNWGWFSLWVASHPGFRGTVHAFEPVAETFADLESVVREAGLEQTITCRRVALSGASGAGRMHLPDSIHSGQAILTVSDPESPAPGTVRVDRLDHQIQGPVQVVKIDAEGHEPGVLEGAAGILNDSKPMIVFENARHTALPEKTLLPLKILSQQGYIFFHLAWQRTFNGTAFWIGDDSDPNPAEQEKLALLPFDLESRFLRHDAMNILACHRSRAGELEARFGS